ncbi:MAG: hypothetical protein HY891_05530 [Deltaproteobacteria bacterium]|nr:hypothetical protein [Deltaproteobacteria bacterium]
MSDYSKTEKPIEIEQTALTWMAVYGNCWLALRHPQNNGSSRALIESFLVEVEEKLIECGMFTREEMEMIRRLESGSVTGPPEVGCKRVLH